MNTRTDESQGALQQISEYENSWRKCNKGRTNKLRPSPVLQCRDSGKRITNSTGNSTKRIQDDETDLKRNGIRISNGERTGQSRLNREADGGGDDDDKKEERVLWYTGTSCKLSLNRYATSLTLLYCT
jgi:hypothetical protein